MKLKGYIRLAILAHINDADLPSRDKLFTFFNKYAVCDDSKMVHLQDGRMLLKSVLSMHDGEWTPFWETTKVRNQYCEEARVPTSKLEQLCTYCHGSNQWYLNDGGRFAEIGGLKYHVQYGNVHLWSDGQYRTYREHGGDEEINRYHGTPRSWRQESTKDKLYGVEVEMNARKGTHRGMLAVIAKKHGFIAEHDSSLCSVRGVEIIAPPMSFSEHLDDNAPWMKFLEAISGKADGFRAGSDYGMHISINRLHMSRLHSSKLVVFIHNNQSMCEHVAGRQGNQWQQYRRKNYREASREEGEKKEAIAIRGYNRLEVRIFRSQIDPDKFKRNLEFVDAALEFTRHASAKQLTESNFKDYLGKNRKTYPRIANLLCGELVKTKKKGPKLHVVAV